MHAEWLAQRDAKDEKHKLVDATLEAGRTAQLHLADMLGGHPDRGRPEKTPPAPLEDMLTGVPHPLLTGPRTR